MPPAYLKVIEIVTRSNFYYAAAEFPIHRSISDDRDLAPTHGNLTVRPTKSFKRSSAGLTATPVSPSIVPAEWLRP